MNRRAFLWTPLVCLGASSQALGYVIPPRAVLDLGQKALAGSPGLTAELAGRAWSEKASGLKSVSERWSFGEKPSFEVSTDAGRVAHWTQGKTRDPQGLLPSQPLRDICLDLFHLGDLQAMLKRQEVRVDRRHLTIMDGTPMIALGSHGPQPGVPMVWFHHDTHRIMRIILPGHRGGLDIRFRRWHMPSTRDLFPYEMIVLRNGRPVRLLKTQFVMEKAAK